MNNLISDLYSEFWRGLYKLRPTLRLSGAFFSLAPKVFLAYSAWFWAEIFMQIITMLIFLYFWRAVYANAGQATISGLGLEQTLT